jgi:hypothetical protein
VSVTVVVLDASVGARWFKDEPGCSLYDAAAPVLAEMLDAELVSADRRAHDSLPKVRIVG